MKEKISTAGVLFLLLYLLQYPQEALYASKEGMKLWLTILLPTLLPFLILTGYLLTMEKSKNLSLPFPAFWKGCFGVSSYGAYALILGMLCGYPVGAKLCADLYRYGKISRQEAQYLLTFCNNPSPVFLTTYLAGTCLNRPLAAPKILCIFLLSNLFCMLTFRFLVYRNHTIEKTKVEKKETAIACSPGAALDVSIMNGFETLARLGGYILLFSILGAAINHYWCKNAMLKHILLCLTELTTGIYRLKILSLTTHTQYVLSMTAAAFGGLCVLMQTKSVLHPHISIKPYLLAKCLNAFLTFLLAYFLPFHL